MKSPTTTTTSSSSSSSSTSIAYACTFDWLLLLPCPNFIFPSIPTIPLVWTSDDRCRGLLVSLRPLARPHPHHRDRCWLPRRPRRLPHHPSYLHNPSSVTSSRASADFPRPACPRAPVTSCCLASSLILVSTRSSIHGLISTTRGQRPADHVATLLTRRRRGRR